MNVKINRNKFNENAHLHVQEDVVFVQHAVVAQVAQEGGGQLEEERDDLVLEAEGLAHNGAAAAGRDGHAVHGCRKLGWWWWWGVSV